MITSMAFWQRTRVGVAILSLLLLSTLTLRAQIYRRPELPRRNDQPDKTRKTQKHSRGGVITPTTIKVAKDAKEEDQGDSTEAVSSEESSEDAKEKSGKAAGQEWDTDENRSLAKLQVRHKARIILDNRKTPAVKRYIEESETSKEDVDEESDGEDDDSEAEMSDEQAPEENEEEEEDPGRL